MLTFPDDAPISRHVMGCGCASCRFDDSDGAATGRTASTNLTEALDWGTALSDNTVTVYFAPAGETVFAGFGEFYTSEGFNAYERAQFQKAFDRIEAVANLDFQIVSNKADADFTLVLDTDEISDFLGFFNPPGEQAPGVGVFNGFEWDRRADGDLEEGGFGYVTILHELLHGLGMAHPHDDGGGSALFPGVRADDDLGNNDLNQGVHTIMGYNSGYQTGSAGSRPPFNGFYGFEAGPMALDIALLQAKYGAAENRVGDSTYTLPGNNNTGTKWLAIWDTGGRDVITYDGRKDAQIDLRAATLKAEEGGGGYISSAKGVAGGWTIAHGVVIEKATGGAGDDDLTGNGADNVLRGRSGNDVLRGRTGDDKLVGGSGADTLKGGRGADDLFGKAGRDKLDGDNGRDLLSGGAKADRLYGGAGDDTLQGNRGADLLQGGRGADTLTGGDGFDVFRFSTLAQSRAGADSRDTITDFDADRDLINLRPIDADTTRGGNQAFDFIGRAGFADAGDLRLAKRGDDWLLRGDVDGDGTADLEILLRDALRPTQDDILL